MHESPARQHAMGLVNSGLSLSEVSRLTGVSRSTLRVWRDHGTEPKAGLSHCWLCEPHAGVPTAYAALFGYYLGDGCISQFARTRSFRVSCDARLPGIISDVDRLLRAVRPDASVQHVPAPGVIVVQSYWKHWPCLFPQHGPGRKHERHLGMTQWQWEIVEQRPADFLRGLFHSDGSRSRNWTQRTVAGQPKRYDYPRWQFTNCSEEIKGWCCDALDLVEVPWRRSNAKTISVSTRAGVTRLDELIGLKG